jgi:hypothetical protein
MPLGAATEPSAASSAYARRLRPVAARTPEEIVSMRGWRVPLYARPVDIFGVTQLLTSVLCGAAPGCTVTYAVDGVRSAQNW